MATPVYMPKLGMYVEDIALVEWLVAEGSPVQTGQSLFELETDKTTSEVEAESDGILHQMAPAGAKVAIGTVVAMLATSSDEYQSLLADPPRKRQAAAVTTPTDSETEPMDEGRSIHVRERVPLRGARGTIARRMMQSVHDTAQLTSVLEIDATSVLDARQRLAGDGQAVGLSAVFVRLLGDVLPEHRGLNARIAEDEIQLLEEVNIAIGVETDNGVVAPVIRDPALLTTAEIDARIKALASRARQGQLTPDDVDGATFTLSNGGIHPVEITTALLTPPQVAILWLGRVKERPMCVEGAVIPRPSLYLCLTYDHRAVDGGPAAAFLGALASAAERLAPGERVGDG